MERWVLHNAELTADVQLPCVCVHTSARIVLFVHATFVEMTSGEGARGNGLMPNLAWLHM